MTVTTDELPLLLYWERVAQDLLDRTSKMPKAMRFTFAQRIDNHVLDVLEQLAAARYAEPARKRLLLASIDEALARLRILVRLCHGRRLLDGGGYEHVARGLDEAGRMVGGWRQSLTGSRN